VLKRARDTALARTFAQPDTLDFALVQQAFLPVATPAATPAP
jgi:rod shape-determining protein MreC